MFSENIFPAILGCFVTFVIGALIILTQRWHGRWTHDEHEGIQKFHSQPTPRIGGLAIVAGTFISVYFLDVEINVLFMPLLISGLIPFFFGFREDLTKKVSVRDRLLATMAGAIAAMMLTGIYLNHLDVPGLDWLMTWWPIGALITVVAVSGVTNSINILDGFNGLASGTAVIVLSFFAWMAHQSNDLLLTTLCVMLASSVLGFMLLNYPFGKIFLGDAGAYFVGFLVAWAALLLPMRNEEISPWASLLVCAYPIVEVLYSMARRMKAQLKAGEPDNLHLHTLIKTRLVRRHLVDLPTWAKNAMVAPSIWLCSALLGILASLWVSNVLILALLFVGFVVVYHLTYQFLVNLPEFCDEGNLLE
jgi:UDP-N-acetylmuramyl pentapeptide phosphotransferase/UDP-N-acetylglucosamine-1-phosphate transferase